MVGSFNRHTKKKFKKYILDGDYSKAYNISKEAPFEEITDFLIGFSITQDVDQNTFFSNTLASYFFMQHSISQEETAEKHNFLTDLTIANPAGFFIGSGVTTLGMNHMKRACELDPTNIQYKEWLLMFYDDVPGDVGQYLSETDANIIKKQIAELKSLQHEKS